ncbi:efflux RND transporter periplasmic adaptor subunit [Pseudoalteromonas peptidolytica]|uniref:CzcB-like barrel-sandwich hybrid domain-containing protein n=1 Tax=Pseudoalteromonas peptidolytica F12-50-A1 TaxID=1315280 RepID=A0A8I0MVA6_9GAMM|nr:efflux RND transporter periplasmic adaptor subunit [Pseudoalteromonas peptidolytica]MBE0346524.1 hypothetical protein [Pseudoalteromonas peptidolytica F12-50-A1]GEK10553.1 hypothetical protein PPE03_28020 [Pseudoalteromonas peptidolytica]
MFFKFIFLLFTTALLGCSVEPKEEVAEYIVKPEVFEAVELVETVPTKRFYSTITGSDVVDVASLSTARIKSLSAFAGKRVVKGEVLAALYSPTLETQLREKQSQLTSAQQAQAQAERDFERLKKLFAKKLVSDSVLDIARLELDQQVQQVRSAKVLLEEARNMLNEQQIVAPSDGIITNNYARAGDVVDAGQPIFQLQTLTTLKAEFLLPEQEYIDLAINQTVTIYVPSINKRLTGKVIEKSLPSMAVGRLFKLTVDLNHQSPELVGLLSRLELAITHDPLFRVPASAIHYDLNKQAYVFVAQPELERFSVNLLGNEGDKVLVTAPRLAGQDLLVTSAAKLGVNLAMLRGQDNDKK